MADEDTPDALPCCMCARRLDNLGDGWNQPSRGTAFSTAGHYGSAFDPMSGGTLEINICDECLAKLASVGGVAHYDPPEFRARTMTIWAGPLPANTKG